MSTTVPSYPFDPTGTKASNKIAGEQQILTASNPRDNYFIIPKVAPFFEEGLSISFKDSATGVVRTLKKNIDYYPTHLFLDASYSTARPIYGSITFLNTALAGTVTLAYQTVGGEWVPSAAVIAEALANRLSNPRTTSWEQIVNPPNAFPVIEHPHDLINMKGMDDVIVSIRELTQAIATRGGNDLAAHKIDKNNPHGVTAAQLNVFTKEETEARINQLISVAMAGHLNAFHP